MATPTGKSSQSSFSPGISPRVVLVKRSLKQGGNEFGFTLRHFIVYPPDEDSDYPEELKRRIESGSLGNPNAPMDTIFIKHVRENSPAAVAGLRTGDRIIQVNGDSVVDRSYAQVVQMIQTSGPNLKLVVVPKEEDIIQLCFKEAAHAPQTNPRPNITMSPPTGVQPPQRQKNHNQLLLHLPRPKPYASESTQRPLVIPGDKHAQTSAKIFLKPFEMVQNSSPALTENCLHSQSLQSYKSNSSHQQQMLAQKRSFLERPNLGGEKSMEECNRLAVPTYLNRSLSPIQLSSGGLTLPSVNLNRSLSPYEGRSRYSLALDNSVSLSETSSRRSCVNIDPSKPFSAFHYLKSQDGSCSNSTPSLNNKTDGASTGSLPDRRDSNASMEANDSVMNRIRKSFEQKEEFLNRPYWPSPQSPPVPKEFYVQPQKLPKPLIWPPTTHKLTHSHSLPSDDSVASSDKPSQSQSVDAPEPKTTVEQLNVLKSVEPWSLVFSVRKITPPNPNGNISPTHTIISPGSVGNTTPRPFYGSSSSVSSGSESPSASPISGTVKQKGFVTTLNVISENANGGEIKRAPLARIDEIVQTPSPQDKSEAKLTITKVISSQQAREQKKEGTRSTDVQGVQRRFSIIKKMATANRKSYASISEPPVLGAPTDTNIRAISKSYLTLNGVKGIEIFCKKDSPRFRDTDISYGVGMSGNRTVIIGSNKLHCEPPSEHKDEQPKDETDKHARLVRPSDLCFSLPPTPDSLDESLDNYFVSPLSTPGSIASDFGETVLEQFDDMLASFSTRAQLLKSSHEVSVPNDSTSMLPSIQVAPVNRRVKIVREDDEERAMRRISYRKATASDRLHVDTDTDLSDQEQRLSSKNSSPREAPISPTQIKERPSGATELAREGWVNMKITHMDGKRATDRSWHQVWLRLKNETLTMHKDKRDGHLLGSVQPSEGDQVFDLKGATVDIACDYTKRRHVFRLSFQSGAEYLLQCEDDNDMLRWMQLLQEASGNQNEFSASAALFKAAMEGNKKKKLEPFYRNRSPTGHSPVSKTRKSSSTSGDPPMSPVNTKPRNWKNKVTKEISRRFRSQGIGPSSRYANDSHSPSSSSREGKSFDTPLELCPMSCDNRGIPLLVDLCVRLVEARGLDVVGIYRVPGNNGAVNALTNSINQGFENVNFQDVRWGDANVISSLLKQFFRKLPDPVLTSELYPKFIEASKIENDLEKRKHSIKSLIDELPDVNYRTISFLIRHLARVAEKSQTNKMDVKNLAIIFGPSLIRPSNKDTDIMGTMVKDMSQQSRIVETLITDALLFFGDDEFDVTVTNCPDVSFDEKGGGSTESVVGEEDKTLLSPRHIVTSILKSCAQRISSSDPDIGASSAMEKSLKVSTRRELLDDKRRSSVSSTQSSSTGTGHGSVQSLPESAISTLVGSTTKSSQISGTGSISSRKEGSVARISQLLAWEFAQGQNLSAMTSNKLKKHEADLKAALESELERQKKGAELRLLEKKQIEEAFEKAKMDMESEDYLDVIADDPAAVRVAAPDFTQGLKSLSLQSDEDNPPTTTQSSSQSDSFHFSDNLKIPDKFSQSADQVMLYIDEDLSEKRNQPSPANSCPLLSPNVIPDSRYTPVRNIGSFRFCPNDQSTPVEKENVVSPKRSQIPVQSRSGPRRVVETRMMSTSLPQPLRTSQLRRTTTAPLLDRVCADSSSSSLSAAASPLSSKIVRQSTFDSAKVTGASQDKDFASKDDCSPSGKGEKFYGEKELIVRQIETSHQQPVLETSLDEKLSSYKENQDPDQTLLKCLSLSEDRRRLNDVRNRDPKVRRSNSLTKDEKTESNNKAREYHRRTDSNRLHENRHSRSLRVRGTRDSGLKRRHTVGGTRDFDKVRFRWMVYEKPNTEEKVSAWDQLQPLVNDEDLNIDRTLRAWMRKERLRTSSPELMRKSDTIVPEPSAES
ncbi:rho GTPase-activating protein 21-B-like [Artemia franciscana]|uniref:rho GTPase-activating protein 21-B-like n=1 Tax=Artemia franciscana TaxID=6661 RepID=UPI0032DAA69E